jgi:predicted alpha/beta superfamily hydrolase
MTSHTTVCRSIDCDFPTVIFRLRDPLLATASPTTDAVRVDSVTGELHLKTLSTRNLPGERVLRIYLPPRYWTDELQRYPVLYLHDGQNVFSGDTSFIPNQEWKADEATESLIDTRLIESIMIVAIDNGKERRADEYLPTAVVREDGTAWGGAADQYARMVIEEIKPFIDQTYRTKPDARNTALCGSSLGGVITLYMGLQYPSVFGKLALISPSLWWDDGVMLKQAALARRHRQRYWIDMGTGEAEHMPEAARELGNLFEAKGWRRGKDLAVYIDGYAAHGEAAWARRFPIILMFLFGRRS